MNSDLKNTLALTLFERALRAWSGRPVGPRRALARAARKLVREASDHEIIAALQPVPKDAARLTTRLSWLRSLVTLAEREGRR